MIFLVKIKKFVNRYLLPLFYRMLPIKNRYFFSSFYGRYSDSPKVISEQLHKKKPNVLIYWSVDPKKQVDVLPKYINVVKTNSFLESYILWTSKFLIDNCQKQLVSRLRSNQVYLQTWHGTPLKRIEFDAENKLPKHYLRYSYYDNKSTKYLMIGNQYSERIYKSAFKIPLSSYVRSGVPRNDLLVNADNTSENFNKKINLGINSNTFVILYAPTFRNSIYYSSENGFDQLNYLNPKRLLKIMKEEFGKECVIITHFHPNMAERISKKKIEEVYGGKVIDLTKGYELIDLMRLSDMLITDYSSVMFDYALLKKPILLFSYDYKEYKKERGVYLNIVDLPLYVAKNIEEIEEILKNNSLSDLSKKTVELNKRLGSFEVGSAADTAVNLLLEK